LRETRLSDWAAFLFLVGFIATAMWAGAEEPKLSIDIPLKTGKTTITTLPLTGVTIIHGATEAIVRNYPLTGVTTVTVREPSYVPPPVAERPAPKRDDDDEDEEDENEER
jgi:hypothetical protein